MKTKTLRLPFPICFSISSALALAALALLGVVPAALGASFTNVYNTVGTTNWICPAGVTNIQVECWGGGGGGGGCAGYTSGRASGSGGAGGYAKINSMSVTPGTNYTITIPAAAGGGVASTNTSSPGTNGANVYFTGASNITVVAYGGNGGTNMIGGVSGGGGPQLASGGCVTNFVTMATSAADTNFVGGAGNPVSSSVGGGGGSGPSDLGNGTNGLAATAAVGGAPGSDSVHNGGPGAAGNNSAGSSGKTPSTGPGGGGGGARCNATNTFAIGGAGAPGQIVLIYVTPPADAVKQNNADNLNLGSSWVSGRPPTSLGLGIWDGTVTGPNTVLLGADTNWLGIVISNVVGAVTINAGNTLGLGVLGIDMSGATADLTLNCGLSLTANQNWNVASGRTLNVGGSVSGSVSLTQPGSGTVKLTAANVLPSGSTYNLNAGTLDLNGNSQAIGTLSGGGGTVDTVVGGTPTLAVAGGAFSPTVFSGVIQNSSGTLSLTKQGTNTLTLGGNNTYSGVTTINGGTLAITSNNGLGNTTGNTVFTCTGVTPDSPQLSLSGQISCPENITISGLTETNNNKPAIVSGGTNTLNGNITLSSLTGAVRFTCGTGGQLIFAGNISQTGSSQQLLLAALGNNSTIIVNNPIANNGGDLKVVSTASTGIGTVLLNGAGGSGLGNTFILQTGTLQLGADNALNTTGNLQIGQASGNTTATAGQDIGKLDLNGHNLMVNALGGYVNGGNNGTNNSYRVVTNSAATGSTLTVGNGGGGDTFNGVIWDGVTASVALTKVGSGTETLAGASTYSGGTIINGGTLLLINTNGSATGSGNVTVNSVGTLGGTGVIAGIVTNSGTLQPGTNGIGTLTISGNATLNTNSTNTFAVNGSTTAHTSVALGGSVTYGGQLKILPSGTFTNNQTFTLFSGAGAASASNFGSVVGSTGTGQTFSFTNGVLTVMAASGPTGSAHLTNSVSGNMLSLSWPSGQGWRLQMQTNSLSSGLGTIWVYVTDGTASSTNITVSPTNPTVFYRLTYP